VIGGGPVLLTELVELELFELGLGSKLKIIAGGSVGRRMLGGGKGRGCKPLLLAIAIASAVELIELE
jgi:hypothetical protein